MPIYIILGAARAILCSKRVSDVKFFGHSAKKEMRCWCLMLSPPSVFTPSQVGLWKVSQQGQAWCAQWAHYYPERGHKSHQKVAALYIREIWGIWKNELCYIQRWVRVVIKCVDTHEFKGSEYKEEDGGGGCYWIRCMLDSY